MMAYQVNTDGLGYTTDSNKFFWSRISAGKFCEKQLYENLLASVQKYVGFITKAFEFGHTYRTINRDTAFNVLSRFTTSQHPESILELALDILSMEVHLRAIIPAKRHPYHFQAKDQCNDIIWLCIRIRKQFKIQT